MPPPGSMSTHITVAIVEDDARIRRNLAAMLGTADDIANASIGSR